MLKSLVSIGVLLMASGCQTFPVRAEGDKTLADNPPPRTQEEALMDAEQARLWNEMKK